MNNWFCNRDTQLWYLLRYLTSCSINWCLNDARNSDNVRFHVFQGTYKSFWKSTFCQKDQVLLSTSEALNICKPTFVFYFHFFPSAVALRRLSKKKKKWYENQLLLNSFIFVFIWNLYFKFVCPCLRVLNYLMEFCHNSPFTHIVCNIIRYYTIIH